ncbi:peptidoglycan -binding protein [Pseudophaeobacter leonis]|uniref:peptidoglycan -binding protein n=1 Tax=Pseudophaeobacter leonis TaxID=1144477 RepID=UPI003B97E380
MAAAEVAQERLSTELEKALTTTLEAAKAQTQDRDELAERLTRILAQMQVTQSAAEGRVSALETELTRLRQDSTATREQLTADLAGAREAAAQSKADLEAELARQRATNVESETQYQAELENLQNQHAATLATLQQQMATLRTEADASRRQLESELAALQADAASVMAGLETELSQAQNDLVLARNAASSTAQERALIETRLLQALDALENAQAAASEQAVLQQRLLAALNAQSDAETSASEQRDLAQARADLLAQAQDALSEQRSVSEKAQRETALLNQQVAALREQLGGLQAILDDYQQRDVAQNVQLQNLGQDLNAALARAASEERRRRLLEEGERKRLEVEAERLASRAEDLETKAEDLERYRSEFFGRLRNVLGNQEGVRIAGDRFVFASEVLFDPGSATLSAAGEVEIAKVARILQTVAAEIPPELNWIIRVDGHTDNTAMLGSPKYSDNWELSQGRALSVVRFMIEGLGIPPGRLAANGFGEYQPVNPADTPEARAQNRRIELKFTERLAGPALCPTGPFQPAPPSWPHPVQSSPVSPQARYVTRRSGTFAVRVSSRPVTNGPCHQMGKFPDIDNSADPVDFFVTTHKDRHTLVGALDPCLVAQSFAGGAEKLRLIAFQCDFMHREKARWPRNGQANTVGLLSAKGIGPKDQRGRRV